MEMSKIKFRAWDKVNKEMVHVSNIDFFMKEVIIIDCNTHATDERSFGEVILEQYTGLKDKNGVEIYEGDIVKAFDEYNETEFKGEVKYGSGSFCITDNKGFSGYRLMDYDMEVLGNIYENKELLKC